MVTCKDCLHVDVCNAFGLADEINNSVCEHFSPKVVRCKDCKWYQIRRWDANKPQYDCRKTHALLDVKPDDFCSYGERRGGE